MYELIEKYINGQLTAEELALLKSYLATCTQEELKAVMHKVWDSNDGVPAPSEEQLLRMKHGIDARIAETEGGGKMGVSRIRLSHWVLRVAAVLLPLFVVATVYLMESNRRMNRLMENKLTFVTGEGQQASVNLPDGSLVNLNQNSKLEYTAAAFRHGKRSVRLEGEAYFNVNHREDDVFVVAVSDAEVSVLGTEFNVEARSGKAFVTVILDKGRLHVMATKTRRGLNISSGDEAVIDRRTGNISISTLEKAPVRVDWLNKSLVFHDASLENVLQMLEKTYSINFQRQMRGKCRFHGVLPADNLEESLRIICKTCNLKVRNEKERNTYVVSDR